MTADVGVVVVPSPPGLVVSCPSAIDPLAAHARAALRRAVDCPPIRIDLVGNRCGHIGREASAFLKSWDGYERQKRIDSTRPAHTHPHGNEGRGPHRQGGWGVSYGWKLAFTSAAQHLACDMSREAA